MSYTNESQEMQKLLQNHRSAKSKMVKGIVLTAIGYFLLCFGIGFLCVYFIGIIFLIPAIPMLIVGIISLINGIKGIVKANRDIKAFRKQNSDSQFNNHDTYQSAESQFKDNYDFQSTESQFKDNYDFQSTESQYQGDYDFQSTESQYQSSYDYSYNTSSGFVDIDLAKYAPLECGVTYKHDKDYKFHRADGFVGSVPQKFVDRTFPRCPLCCKNHPNWTIAGETQMSWKGNLYYFKCSCCDGVISMSVPDVTTLGNGGSGVALHPSVGVANLIAKSSSGKEAGAVYAVIESVGTSGVSNICEGKEFKLEHMQDMFLRM